VLVILSLSANTAFADFPRLCKAVAHDGFLPHSFGYRGRRLVYSEGIYVLAVLSGILLIIFRGVTDRLIPLFAIGAFLAFTLSQAGMVGHWRRNRGRGAGHKDRAHNRLLVRIQPNVRGGTLFHDRLLSYAALVPPSKLTNPRSYDRGRSFHRVLTPCSADQEEEKLTGASQRLQAKVDAFRTKKETIKATYTAAEAQTKINEAFSGISEELGDVGMAIQRAEDKTAQMQARGQAIDELLASGALDDASGTSKDSITVELERMASTNEVESQLEKSRAIFDLYMPFVWDNRPVFRCAHVRELYERLAPADRQRIPWDPVVVLVLRRRPT